MEDNDIKIFNSSKSDDKIDEIALIAEMEEQRGNGNIDKARKLGNYLAAIFVNDEALLRDLEPVLGDTDFPEPILFQVKILMFFAAEYCINSSLPKMILKNTAVNALYDSIRDEASKFYKEFSDGAEYSFYYLAIRKGSNIINDIGASFSMLCGKEKDEHFTLLGEKIWEVILKEVEKIIISYEFKM